MKVGILFNYCRDHPLLNSWVLTYCVYRETVVKQKKLELGKNRKKTGCFEGLLPF